MDEDDINICPVCGDEFVPGLDKVEIGASYEAKICITGDDECLIHLPGVDTDDTGNAQYD